MTPASHRHRKSSALAIAPVFALLLMSAAWAATPGFTPQVRVGFAAGDQWEPAIAADGYGHAYILYPQYGRIPGCRGCPLPSMILVVSDDNGARWQPPREITPPGTGQYDPQIVVDPADRRTVYAAWLQNRKTDMVVAKSVDFGQSWSIVIADRGATDADKPVLAVRGQDVYVGFNRDGKIWMASSHDGGVTFASANVNPSLELVRALAGGATVDPGGNVHLAWAGYTRRGASKGRVNLYISKSLDGGKSWTTTVMDSSGAPPECSAYHCERGYLGAQITMTSDAAGTLYALWNAGASDKSPERIYFASSTTAGDTWSPRMNVSTMPTGVEHAFPALVAGAAGTCASPGWIPAAIRNGTRSIAARATAAPRGRRNASSPATYPGTATSGLTASAFLLEITSGWGSTRRVARWRCGAKGSTSDLRVLSGTARKDDRRQLFGDQSAGQASHPIHLMFRTPFLQLIHKLLRGTGIPVAGGPDLHRCRPGQHVLHNVLRG